MVTNKTARTFSSDEMIRNLYPNIGSGVVRQKVTNSAEAFKQLAARYGITDDNTDVYHNPETMSSGAVPKQNGLINLLGGELDKNILATDTNNQFVSAHEMGHLTSPVKDISFSAPAQLGAQLGMYVGMPLGLYQARNLLPDSGITKNPEGMLRQLGTPNLRLRC
jgi:hypothetical protein